MLHLHDYEKPEGWSPGQPEVLARKSVIDALGEPVVNYDSLHQFMTDNLELPYDDPPLVKLYGRSENPFSRIAGYTIPLSKTVHINAPCAERGSQGTMGVLAHELQHRSDIVNKKSLTCVAFGLKAGATAIGFKVGHELSYLSVNLWHAPIIGSVAAGRMFYKIDPLEIRARRMQHSYPVKIHEMDILFPNSIRTESLAFEGLISEELASKLGDQIIEGSRQGRERFGDSFKRLSHEAYLEQELRRKAQKSEPVE